MASFLLPNGMQVFLDANGNPMADGTVEHFVPSTMTPKTTWSDRLQTTANSTTIELDIAGRATIWGVGVYRQIVKNSLGVTQWDKEVSSTGADQFFTPQQYGAVGDGVSDDAPAFQEMVDESAGRLCYIPAGIYRWNSQVESIAGDSESPALNWLGDGSQNTIIRGYVEDDYLLRWHQSEAYVFQYGGGLNGICFEQVDDSVLNQTCFGIEGLWQSYFHDVCIFGFTGEGIAFPESSILQEIPNVTTTNGAATATMPHNAALLATIIPGSRFAGPVGTYPAGAIITLVVAGDDSTPDQIIFSNAALVSATQTLEIIGNPDGNSSAWLNFDQCRIWRNHGWGVKDFTSTGIPGATWYRTSISLNRKGNFWWQSSHLNFSFGGMNGTVDRVPGPGMVLTGSDSTPQGAYIGFTEFDGNSIQIYADNFRGVEIDGVRNIGHTYDADENVWPLIGMRFAPSTVIPNCTVANGSAVVTNVLSVATVGTTNNSNALTGDFSGALHADNTVDSIVASGDRITGTGIPEGTILARIIGTTGAEMTKNATATGTITASVFHAFNMWLFEGMPVSKNPRQVIDVTTTSGSDDISTTGADGNTTFADVNVGDQVVGLGSAGPSIPDGTTVTVKTDDTHLTLSNNVTVSRTSAQLLFLDPGITYGTTIASIDSDSQITLSAVATASLSNVELTFGDPTNAVTNINVNNNIVRTVSTAGPNLLGYPHYAFSLGTGLADIDILDTVYSVVSDATSKFDIESLLQDINIVDNGVQLVSLGTTPFALTRERRTNQVIASGVLTQIQVDEIQVDRSTTFTTSGIEPFKVPIPIENVTTVLSDTDITAAAMPLTSFNGTSGDNVLTSVTFNIGSCTTGVGSRAITRALFDFAAAGVRVGMVVTGTDMVAGALVSAVAVGTVTVTFPASGTTVGTATITFQLPDLRRLTDIGATVEHANIPAGTVVDAVDATTITLSNDLSGNITAGTVNFFNLTALVDGDQLTLSIVGTAILNTANPSLIVGTPTKNSAVLSAAANSSTTGNLIARGYQMPTTRSITTRGVITTQWIATGSKVEIVLFNVAEERRLTFYANGPGSATNYESFPFEFDSFLAKDYPLSVMISVGNGGLAFEVVSLTTTTCITYIPIN